MKWPVQGLEKFEAKIHGFGPVLAFFPTQIMVNLTVICIGKISYNWSPNHEFSLKNFSRPCRGHFIGQKCYFCVAKSSCVQKNTTFFDEVGWPKIRVKNEGTRRGAPNLASSHICSGQLHTGGGVRYRTLYVFFALTWGVYSVEYFLFRSRIWATEAGALF